MTPEFTCSAESSNFDEVPFSALRRALLSAAPAGSFAIVAPAPAQTPTLLVLRAVPAKLKKGETAAALPPLTKADVGDIKIGGKVGAGDRLFAAVEGAP